MYFVKMCTLVGFMEVIPYSEWTQPDIYKINRILTMTYFCKYNIRIFYFIEYDGESGL